MIPLPFLLVKSLVEKSRGKIFIFPIYKHARVCYNMDIRARKCVQCVHGMPILYKGEQNETE